MDERHRKGGSRSQTGSTQECPTCCGTVRRLKVIQSHLQNLYFVNDFRVLIRSPQLTASLGSTTSRMQRGWQVGDHAQTSVALAAVDKAMFRLAASIAHTLPAISGCQSACLSGQSTVAKLNSNRFFLCDSVMNIYDTAWPGTPLV